MTTPAPPHQTGPPSIKQARRPNSHLRGLTRPHHIYPQAQRATQRVPNAHHTSTRHNSTSAMSAPIPTGARNDSERALAQGTTVSHHGSLSSQQAWCRAPNTQCTSMRHNRDAAPTSPHGRDAHHASRTTSTVTVHLRVRCWVPDPLVPTHHNRGDAEHSTFNPHWQYEAQRPPTGALPTARPLIPAPPGRASAHPSTHPLGIY